MSSRVQLFWEEWKRAVPSAARVWKVGEESLHDETLEYSSSRRYDVAEESWKCCVWCLADSGENLMACDTYWRIWLVAEGTIYGAFALLLALQILYYLNYSYTVDRALLC
jgi:hypothetical protein